MKPAIQITTHKDTSLSKSFFGGLPKVPKNFEWPYWDSTPSRLDEIKYAEKKYLECKTDYWKDQLEKSQKQLLEPLIPLTFLGQVHLDEVPRNVQFPNLPSSGILYFFCDCTLYPPGWRASSKGSCQVIYVEETSELQTLPFPNAMFEKFRDDPWFRDDLVGHQSEDSRCSLSFTPQLSPSTTYFDEPKHLLFGDAMVIQEPMEEMCQLCFHGFDAYEYHMDSEVAHLAHLREGVEDWQLLLQLDCDDNLDWEWGDAGMVYFWIRSQDLEQQNFSNVWWELQCA
jgi:uncharacterized protein YwqG